MTRDGHGFRQPLALLMTATIDPGVYAETLTRSDPGVRLGDYLAAIRSWQRYPDARISDIVFCDNSGADLSELRRRCAPAAGEREVEFLGFRGNERPPGMQYGYAELGTIDYALAHSRVIDRTRFFAKVTGRLLFPRLSPLLDRLDPDLSMAADSRRSYAKEGGPPTRVRTQLMIFRTSFYRERLAGRRSEMMGLCTVIEEFLAFKALEFHALPGVQFRWPIECPPAGIAGNGADLASWKERAKSTVRGGLRRVAPGWWL